MNRSKEYQELMKELEESTPDLCVSVQKAISKRNKVKYIYQPLACIAMITLVIFFLSSTILGNFLKYKRISFSSDTLGEDSATHLTDQTVVINNAAECFPSTVPIYKISEAKITNKQLQTLSGKFDEVFPGEYNKMRISQISDGKLSIDRIYQNNNPQGDFVITEEELEKRAWQVLELITFLDGDYEYTGIYGISRITYPEDKAKTLSITISFSKRLDGIRITGSERVLITFDLLGVESIYLDLYEYKIVGTMELVPLEDATAKIKEPDAFSVFADEEQEEIGSIHTLQVERVKLLLVNQHYRDCTILQPVYNFIGTATDADGNQAEFHSKIIAIPESYTYEDKDVTD